MKNKKEILYSLFYKKTKYPLMRGEKNLYEIHLLYVRENDNKKALTRIVIGLN